MTSAVYNRVLDGVGHREQRQAVRLDDSDRVPVHRRPGQGTQGRPEGRPDEPGWRSGRDPGRGRRLRLAEAEVPSSRSTGPTGSTMPAPRWSSEGDANNTHLIGGTLRALPQPKNAKFGKYVLTPREVRKLIAETGWNAVVAFQTRNPLHRGSRVRSRLRPRDPDPRREERRRRPEPAHRRNEG